MEVIGKLIQMLPERSGTSEKGPWVSGGFVIETDETYPRKIAFDVWGADRLAAIKNINFGTTIKVVFNIESREWNERWYTSCRCTNVETFASAMPQSPYNQQAQPYVQTMGVNPMPNQAVPPAYNPAPQSQMPNQQPATGYMQPPVMNNTAVESMDVDALPDTDDDLPF